MEKFNLYQRIYDEVRKIPRGKVATYGQIATLIGFPRAAQVVGWALKALPEKTPVPWPRVVNREGRITIENPKFSQDLQAKLLRKEKIKVQLVHDNYFVDLKKYLWKV